MSPTSASILTEPMKAPAKARKPRKKSRYMLQKIEGHVWEEFKTGQPDDSFVDAAAARKFVRDGQHVGKFRVIRVVSEFATEIEERKVVKFK